jgi:molybdenum cofactor cytidylyltransferase
MTRLAALLPAAGMSSRMGPFKPLLPLGTGTVLALSVRTFRAAGVERVVVITGHRAKDVAREAEAAGAETAHNPDFEKGMFTSIQAGVRVLEDADHFFVLPADIPLVRPQTVRLLARTHLESDALLTCPTFLGEHGHPPLLSRDLAPLILDHDGQGGLRAVLEQVETRQPNRMCEHACADAGVLADLDSPEDYEAALDRVDMDYPLPEECRALWDMQGLDEPLRDHCREVALVARLLTATINAGQPGERQLSENLAMSAALVHDLAKGRPDHARAGAEILRMHGFPRAADIVAAHPDLELPPDAPLTEREIVFLADKYVRGSTRVPLEARYQAKLERYGADPEAARAIQGRLDRAQAVRDRVQATTPLPLTEILEIAT